MATLSLVDPFATKGAEYILVLVFLVAFVLYWRLLGPSSRRGQARAGTVAAGGFRLPPDRYYHPGHGWVVPEGDGLFRVGLDDFAWKLLGEASAVELPQPGARVEQGRLGWQVRVGARSLPVLSPVDGEVVEVNESLAGSPRRVHEDPYGEGWLLKVRPSRARSNVRNLLSGRLARAWMEETVRLLGRRAAEGEATVLADGGMPVTGLARVLSPDDWEAIAREFLGTSDADE